MEHCNNVNALNFVNAEECVDMEMKASLLSDFKLRNTKYCEWDGGVYWDNTLGIDSFCDVIMHLVFLGITKASRELVIVWMKESKILRDYNACSKTMFESISDIGLEWCKVIVSDSGWVSDNHLAYVRLIKWFYHPICMLNLKESLMEEYVEPNIPLKN